MKAVRITGIILICLQLTSFLGNSNSGSPIRLSFDSLEVFLFDLFSLIGYCFIGIIGVMLLIWGVFSKDNKEKQHTEPQIKKNTQNELKIVNMVQGKTNGTENDVMNSLACPKCNIEIPDDSVFCPNCGCNLEETQKQLVAEDKTEPEIKVVEKVVVKKNKTNKILIVLLVLSLIACSALGYFTHSFYNQIEEKDEIIKDYKSDLNDAKTTINMLNKDIEDSEKYSEILSALTTYDNLGYATENFHTDTGVIVLSKYSDAKEITLYSTYGGAAFTFDNSNTGIVDVYWEEATKDKDGESKWDKIRRFSSNKYVAPANFSSTKIIVKPKKNGISVLTITNSKFDNEVKILIIVN